MSRPTPADVAAFVGVTSPGEGWTAKASSTIGIVEQMVRAYVRGNGFDELGEPNDALAAVIVTATARLMANPELTRQQSAGPYSITHGLFNGWTLPEIAVLHGYRRRAC